MPTHTILVNRAPVLTLWAAVVAERLGHPREEALTLGKAVAGLNAQSKGRRLGIFEAPKAESEGRKKAAEATRPETILLLGRAVPVTKTAEGVRAAIRGKPENPALVERYLEQKFGAHLHDVSAAMRELARALPPRRLEDEAFGLYEAFRPEIPEGVKGWGAKGVLDLRRIHQLAERERG